MSAGNRAGLLVVFAALTVQGCSGPEADDDDAIGSTCSSVIGAIVCNATCEAYVAALDNCFSDYGGDSGSLLSIDDGTCDLIGDGDYDWRCAIDAIEAEDCSTLEGITAASTGVGACAN